MLAGFFRQSLRRHIPDFVHPFPRLVANRLPPRRPLCSIGTPTSAKGIPAVKTSTATLLICCGAAIFAVIAYDASVPTQLLGMSRVGGEGLVALTGLVGSACLLAAGLHGLVRQWVRGAPRAIA